MAESQYSYGTSILTTKTPHQASQIIKDSITGTQTVVENRLLTWFTEYSKAVQRHNQALTELLRDGSHLFNGREGGEYDGFFRMWNSVLSSIQSEIHSNEALFKTMKLESIGPLRDLSQKDVRYSELAVNLQELDEISRELQKGGSGSEVLWNVKAPQIFNNFENFKKHELQLLFDVSVSFLNALNNKYTKSIGTNENAVNYILSDYKLDGEMEHYLKYLLNKKKFASGGDLGVPAPNQARRVSGNDLQSLNSAKTSTSTATAKKRQSKLKSKVGSIFGLKTKSKKLSNLNNSTIPETGSVSSENAALRMNASTDSFGNAGAAGNGARAPQRRPTTGSADLYQHYQDQRNPPQQPQPVQNHEAYPGQKVVTQQVPISTANQQTFMNSQPPQVPKPPQAPPYRSADTRAVQNDQKGSLGNNISTMDAQIPSTIPLTPRNHQAFKEENLGTPNIQRYQTESSDDELEDPSNHGRRLSMLQKHDLDQSPQFDSADASPFKDSEPKFPSTTQNLEKPGSKNYLGTDAKDDRLGVSRQSSAERYSFEADDDKKPISATPRLTQNPEFVDPLPEPEPDIHDSAPSTATLATSGTGASAAAVNLNSTETEPLKQTIVPVTRNTGSSLTSPTAPAPPPSRRVNHSQQTPGQSHLHNKEVPPVPGTASRSRKEIHSQIFHDLPNARNSFIKPQSLVSQDTGSSLLKHNELFKHFDSNYVEAAGLNASVAEVINANFINDQLVKSQVIGEIAFNYKANDDYRAEPILLRIPNNFDKVILNNSFITKLTKDEFKINPELILSKTLGGLKYLNNITYDGVPILVQQVWKFEEHQASLMINLSLNRDYAQELTVQNLVVSVTLTPESKTTSASSRPQGSFNKDKNRITWRYNAPLQFTSTKPEEKLIARFMTNGMGAEHESGIQLKFCISNPPKKLPILNYQNEQIQSTHNLISGSYSSHS